MIHVLSCVLSPLPRAVDGSGEPTGTPERLLVPEPDADDPYAALAAPLAVRVRAGHHVLVVLPEWADDAHLLHLQAVRSSLDSTRVVLHRTALPPLSAAWLVDQLAWLAEDPRLIAADLVRAALELERRFVAVALLGTVAKLRHPAPSLSLHARSWLRGAAFVATIDDAPRVQALRRDEPLPLPAAIPEGWQIAMAAGDGDVERVRQGLDAAGLPEPSIRVDADEVSRAWWGTGRLVELAFRPTISSLHIERLVSRRDEQRCHWCGEHLIDLDCSFCRMRAAVPVADSLGGHA